MTVDILVAFAALEQHGIHVARSAYVDSEEAAVAFAERRDASDPRFLPITLRSTASLPNEELEPLRNVATVRAAYKRLSSEKTKAGERILAQILIENGTPIELCGTTDARLGKLLSIGTDLHGVGRAVPLTAESAESLAETYRAYGHRVASKKLRHMLSHLIMRVSELFETPEITELRLDVRLHDDSYSVTAAMLDVARPLRLKKRLGRRAHDRKGDDYHVAGRQ